MRLVPAVGLMFLLAACAPIVRLEAQTQQRPGQAVPRFGYDEGYRQGQRYGQDHGRGRQPFGFNVILEYRRGDSGYRSQYGPKDRYVADFRFGFETGYREAYERYYPNSGYGRGYPGGGYPGGGYPGGGYGSAVPRYDIAGQQGFKDGYEAGFSDGQHRRRNDPVAESRYRSGDHGYNGRYLSRQEWKDRYRDGFRDGYERGYRDGLPRYR